MSDLHLLISWMFIRLYMALENLNAKLNTTWFMPWNLCFCKVFFCISDSQAFYAAKSLEDLSKHRWPGLTPRVPDSFSLEGPWGFACQSQYQRMLVWGPYLENNSARQHFPHVCFLPDSGLEQGQAICTNFTNLKQQPK